MGVCWLVILFTMVGTLGISVGWSVPRFPGWSQFVDTQMMSVAVITLVLVFLKIHCLVLRLSDFSFSHLSILLLPLEPRESRGRDQEPFQDRSCLC